MFPPAQGKDQRRFRAAQASGSVIDIRPPFLARTVGLDPVDADKPRGRRRIEQQVPQGCLSNLVCFRYAGFPGGLAGGCDHAPIRIAPLRGPGVENDRGPVSPRWCTADTGNKGTGCKLQIVQAPEFYREDVEDAEHPAGMQRHPGSSAEPIPFAILTALRATRATKGQVVSYA